MAPAAQRGARTAPTRPQGQGILLLHPGPRELIKGGLSHGSEQLPEACAKGSLIQKAPPGALTGLVPMILSDHRALAAISAFLCRSKPSPNKNGGGEPKWVKRV